MNRFSFAASYWVPNHIWSEVSGKTKTSPLEGQKNKRDPTPFSMLLMIAQTGIHTKPNQTIQ